MERFKRLFEGCQFFLSREVPREALTFVIRSFGGTVSWEATDAPGSSYPEADESITHQVVDRPVQTHCFLSRYVTGFKFTYVYMYVIEPFAVSRSGSHSSLFQFHHSLWNGTV